MSDYMQDVVSDAFEFLRYNHTAIKEAIAEDTGELTAVLNGGIYDRFCEDLHNRVYSWMEAATIIENCKREEDDASLWFGQKMEDSVQTCATLSYANDVWDMAKELYEELYDKYEMSYDVTTPEGKVLESCEDELDAEDYIDEHPDELYLEVIENGNIDEIWKDFIEEYGEAVE
jgi:hypothetical protein